MREYELYVIIDADLPDEVAGAVAEKVTRLITAGDGKTAGEVIKTSVRGRRRLAYPIKRKVEGLDLLIDFHAPPQTLVEIERALKLDERVLRYLLVRMDE